MSRPVLPERPVAAESLAALAELPGVAEAMEAARQACAQVRWHPALRRRTAEAAAESRVRGASASAFLDGAEPAGSQGSLPLVRDLMRGAQPWPADPDPVWRSVRAAVQVTASSEFMDAAALSAPGQVLARLHLAAGEPLLPLEQVGRPRLAGESCGEWIELGPAPPVEQAQRRLASVLDLLRAVPAGGLPTVLVAAVVHAELVVTRPFVGGNALVARALERVVLRVGGLDPTGVVVPEAGHAARTGADYRGALTAYHLGGQEGVRWWVLHTAQAIVDGAEAGVGVAESVLAGRTEGGRATRL